MRIHIVTDDGELLASLGEDDGVPTDAQLREIILAGKTANQIGHDIAQAIQSELDSAISYTVRR
jgi:hypothetical protein